MLLTSDNKVGVLFLYFDVFSLSVDAPLKPFLGKHWCVFFPQSRNSLLKPKRTSSKSGRILHRLVRVLSLPTKLQKYDTQDLLFVL